MTERRLLHYMAKNYKTLPKRVQVGTDADGKPIMESGYKVQSDFQEGKTSTNLFAQQDSEQKQTSIPIPASDRNATMPAGPSKKGGVIEQKGRARLTAHGITGDAQDAQVNASRTRAAETMSLTGLGVQYDASGKVIPGSGRLGLGQSTVDTSGIDAALAIPTTKDEPTYDANGNLTGSTKVTDPDAVQRQKDAIEKATQLRIQQEKDADAKKNANEANQEVIVETPNLDMPNIDAFISSLPADQQAAATAELAPLMEYYKLAGNNAEKKVAGGMDALDDIEAKTMDYVNKQKKNSEMLFKYFSQLNEQTLANKVDSAKQTADADRAIEDLARQRQESLYDRAIRDQIVTNEEDRKNMFMGLGISGGWRASKQTASVISALKKGENTLSDLYTDAAFSSKDSTVKLQNIERQYHVDVNTAYDAYAAFNAELFTTMMERAEKVDGTIYETSKLRISAEQGLISDYLDAYTEIAGGVAKSFSDASVNAEKRYADQKKLEYDMQKDLMNDTWKYLDTFGTSDIQEVRRRESELGLPPGSLSNARTLEEVRALKAGSGSGFIDYKDPSIQTDLDARLAQFAQKFPNYTEEEALYSLASQLSRETNKAKKTALEYAIADRLGVPSFTTSDVTTQVKAAKLFNGVREAVIYSADPESEIENQYTSLTMQLGSKEKAATALMLALRNQETLVGNRVGSATAYDRYGVKDAGRSAIGTLPFGESIGNFLFGAQPSFQYDQ